MVQQISRQVNFMLVLLGVEIEKYFLSSQATMCLCYVPDIKHVRK